VASGLRDRCSAIHPYTDHFITSFGRCSREARPVSAEAGFLLLVRLHTMEKSAASKGGSEIRTVLLHGNNSVCGDAEKAGAGSIRAAEASGLHLIEPSDKSFCGH
jgi:hypothetical protein